jgi:hypothetical protein
MVADVHPGDAAVVQDAGAHRPLRIAGGECLGEERVRPAGVAFVEDEVGETEACGHLEFVDFLVGSGLPQGVEAGEDPPGWGAPCDRRQRVRRRLGTPPELADPDQLAAVAGHIHDDRLGGRR